MAAKCVTCSRPVVDARMCQVCAGRFEYQLAEFAALDVELELTETRQTALGPRNGSRSSEKPVVFNPVTAEVRADVHATLAGWLFELDPIADRLVSITALSRGLLGRIEQVRQREDAETLVDEIGYCARQGWRAVDRPNDRTRVKVSDCIEVDCPGELWAHIPTDEYVADDPSTHAKITCTACEAEYPAVQWVHLGKRVLAKLAAA